MNARQAALAEVERRDSDIAARIIEELGRPPTDTDCVRNHLERLRTEIAAFGEFATDVEQPSAAKKKIGMVGLHARKTVSCIEDLTPRWSTLLSLAFTPDKAKLAQLMSDLTQVAHRADEIFAGLDDGPVFDLDFMCADVARDLMLELSVKPTKYATYYIVAGLMREALTGEEAVSLKRACDAVIDTYGN